MGFAIRSSRVTGRAAILFVLSAVFAAEARAVLAPGDYNRSFVFDGETRTYQMHVPASYDGATAVPLVLDFHGAGSNIAQQRVISGFLQRSNLEGFIVAWPQGLFNTWNAGLCCGQAASMGINDVGFARELINRIAIEANIDRHRVYSTGLSNGGFLTQRLACEAGDVFAAFAPMAGPIGVSPCLPSRPLPVLMFMGLNDTLVPYATAAPSFAVWRNNASCSGVSPDEVVTSGLSHCDTYTNCADDLEVGLCSIQSTSPPPFEGHVLYFNNDFNLSAVAWDFLSQFSLPDTLESFKCYKASDLHDPKFPGATVTLTDQFGVNDGNFQVTKPFALCNPADVDGAPAVNLADHLTCYKIKGPQLDPADRPTLQAANQLGTVKLQAVKPYLLCVPSSKTILP